MNDIVNHRALRSLLFGGLLVAFLLPGALPDAAAQAQDATRPTLEQAEAYYLEDRFEEAVNLLQQVDKQALPKEEAVEAYHLLTLCYFHQGNLAGAQAAMTNLLQVDPSYRPNPVQDPPSQRFSHSYLRLVRRMRAGPEPMRIEAPAPIRTIYAGPLQEAEEARVKGRSSEALKLAEGYLEEGPLDVVEQVQAHRTRGLVYAAEGKSRKARKAAIDLIVRYPQYELSGQEKEQYPEFAAQVEEARRRHLNGDINRSIRRRKRLKQIAFTTVGTAAAVFIVQFAVRDLTGER